MKKENYLELKEIVDSGFWNIDLVTGVVTGKKGGKGTISHYGYRVHGKGRKMWKSHHIVMIALGYDLTDVDVNHKDGNKLNNAPYNLETLSLEENVIHAHKTGLTNNKGSRNGRAKLSEEQSGEVKKLLSEGVLTQKEIAKRFNVSQQLISTINTQKSWKEDSNEI
ncbi:hypothetical protein F6Y03_30815 [Bacillus megaterium]|nr:hypothetical protein [Priestia megaterium]